VKIERGWSNATSPFSFIRRIQPNFPAIRAPSQRVRDERAENAARLESRLRFLDERILSDYAGDLPD
jgi:hypothetical protein